MLLFCMQSSHRAPIFLTFTDQQTLGSYVDYSKLPNIFFRKTSKNIHNSKNLHYTLYFFCNFFGLNREKKDTIGIKEIKVS